MVHDRSVIQPYHGATDASRTQVGTPFRVHSFNPINSLPLKNWARVVCPPNTRTSLLTSPLSSIMSASTSYIAASFFVSLAPFSSLGLGNNQGRVRWSGSSEMLLPLIVRLSPFLVACDHGPLTAELSMSVSGGRSTFASWQVLSKETFS
jgi:hypothetical protein